MMILDDRRHAGRLLGAAARTKLIARGAGVVLALPRGGVPVGWEVARELGLRLDVFVVRKVRLSRCPAQQIGAMATGGALVLDEPMIQYLGVTADELERGLEEARLEVERTERIHRRTHAPADVSGRTVVLVDDGFTAAETIVASFDALRQLGAAQILLALPAAAPDVVEAAAERGVHLLQLCEDGEGVWFEDPSSPGDHEIRVFLDGSRALTSAAPPPEREGAAAA